MLDYEWVNPSTITLAAANDGSAATDLDQAHRQMFDHNYAMLPEPILHGFNPPHHPLFDPRAFLGASTSSFSPPPLNQIPPLASSHCGLGLGPGLGLLLMPKSDDAVNFSSASGLDPAPGPGLGLNLGGRTYFPSCLDDTVGSFYSTTKTVESILTMSSNFPRCQAEGCNVDLSAARHYHRRHKVCEFHSKAATVVAAGLTQRFCQQCSRFHLLSEFDNGKRSCRKRLADHNRRRRKTQQPDQEIHKSHPSLGNAARSSSESGAQSPSSLKVVASVTTHHHSTRLFPTKTKPN